MNFNLYKEFLPTKIAFMLQNITATLYDYWLKNIQNMLKYKYKTDWRKPLLPPSFRFYG